MKQRTKIFLNAIYLTSIVSVMTGCLGGGGADSPAASPQNPAASVGTLTVANAPTSVGGNFVAVETQKAKIASNMLLIYWSEKSVNHVELLSLILNLANGQIVLQFASTDGVSGGSSGTWICSDAVSTPTDACKGVTIDKAAGTVTFGNQVLSGQEINSQSTTASIITLNGTLNFTPPAGITPTPTPAPNPQSGVSTRRGNTAALISGGAVMGEGITAVGELRKQIAVTVLGANTSLTVGTAYATRAAASLDYADIIVPITNVGTQTVCFVKLAGLTYRDASSTAIGVPGSAYVQGSVGKLSATTFTDTCIAPGETGMVGDIVANLYAKVAKMEFTFETTSGAISVPAASVIPQSYSYTAATGAFAINVKNLGTGAVRIDASRQVFLLDNAELPLSWDYAENASVVVPASGITTIPGFMLYEGLGNKLLAFVGFDDVAVVALNRTFGIALPASEICSASLAADELKLCRIEIRNQRLESLKSTYGAQGSTP